MRVIDITMKLDENTSIYEGDPTFSREVWTSLQHDGYVISKLKMGTHTGTHIDAPCHFIEGGKTAAEIPAGQFIGECKVVNTPEVSGGSCPRVLIRFDTPPRKLSIAQAQRLIDLRVQLVGTNMLSIGSDQVHKLLLANDCIILEGLDLKAVSAGDYFLTAVPLKMDTDGSPVRACLVKKNESFYE